MALNIQRKWTMIKLFSRLELVEKAKVVFQLLKSFILHLFLFSVC